MSARHRANDRRRSASSATGASTASSAASSRTTRKRSFSWRCGWRPSCAARARRASWSSRCCSGRANARRRVCVPLGRGRQSAGGAPLREVRVRRNGRPAALAVRAEPGQPLLRLRAVTMERWSAHGNVYLVTEETLDAERVPSRRRRRGRHRPGHRARRRLGRRRDLEPRRLHRRDVGQRDANRRSLARRRAHARARRRARGRRAPDRRRTHRAGARRVKVSRPERVAGIELSRSTSAIRTPSSSATRTTFRDSGRCSRRTSASRSGRTSRSRGSSRPDA